MDVITTRFGTVKIEAEDVFEFQAGMLGLESCRRWVLLADASNSALGWLQSIERADIAVAVVSPRRFVPSYQIRAARRDLESLQLTETGDAQVLVIVSKTEAGITANLRAPLVFNLERRLAVQIVTKDEQPVRHPLPSTAQTLRRSA